MTAIKESIPKTKGDGEISEAIMSRIRRGIAHYQEFASGIEKIAEGGYLVPSSTGHGKYRVEISLTEDGQDHCVCSDFSYNGEALGCDKHTIAAMIYEARHVYNEAGDDLLDATVTSLETMPGTSTLTREKPRYGMTSEAPGALYDDEPRGKVWEYTGYGEDRTRRFIAEFGTEYGAERAVSDLRAGNERGREILRRSRTSNEAVSYPDTRKEAA